MRDNEALRRLRHHVTGAIERGEKEAIVAETQRTLTTNGRRYTVRLVTNGVRYGLNDCKVHDQDGHGALVEFYYDTPETRAIHGPRGYFVSRYCLGTLANAPGYYGNPKRGHLVLDGGHPELSIDPDTLEDVVSWALFHTGQGAQ